MRPLTDQERQRMDELHRQVRCATNFKRQVELVDKIAEFLGYPPVNHRGPWARQLVQFICAGTDEESSWSGSLTRKRELEVQEGTTPVPEAGLQPYLDAPAPQPTNQTGLIEPARRPDPAARRPS
jgi:hypothetical protein